MPPLSMTMSSSIAAATAMPASERRGPERLADEAPESPGDAPHPRPQSTIGRVCTRRHAATAPAARPSASDSATLKSTMSGVMSEKVSAVSKKRR